MTFAVLEAISNQWLLWRKGAFGHLIGLQGVWILHLLAASLLAHLPLELGDTASCTTASHKANWRIANLDLIWNVQDLDLGIKGSSLAESCVLLVDHHITRAGHVVLVQTLDVQANIVTWTCKVHTLVVHLHSEDLACARIGSSVRWQEDHLFVWLHQTLLHTASQDIANTLDLVDTRDWHSHWSTGWSLRNAEQVVEDIVQGVTVDGLLAACDVHALPPSHVVRFLQQVVAHPARDWHDRSVLLNEVLLPANLDQSALHLVGNLVITSLLVSCHIAVHLVHPNAELLHSKQVDKTRVLPGLSLDLTSLVVTLGNGCGEVTICWHHDQGTVSLGGTCDHVLDEVTVTWGIDNGVVPLLSVELLGGAGDGHTTLTLLLLSVHVECESEGTLAQALCLLLQLLQLTLWKSSQLEDQSACGGALATVDVAADDNGEMFLLRRHCKKEIEVAQGKLQKDTKR